MISTPIRFGEWRARDRALATMQDIAVRTPYASRTDGERFLWNAIREPQSAGDKAHGEAYRQVFEANTRGWHEKKAA